MKKLKYIKKIMAIAGLSLFMGTANVVSANTNNPISLIVDGQIIVNMDAPPVILNDFTYVSARAVFEAAGAAVFWDEATTQVTVVTETDTVVLTIDDIIAFVNDLPVHMPEPPRMINGRTMIPARFTAEALGFEVDWDEAQRVVTIDTEHNSTSSNNTNVTNNNSNDLPIIDDYDHSGEDTLDIDGFYTNGALARDVSTQNISSANHPETRITALQAPAGGNIVISASSEISRIETFLLADNRLVIDIYNAELNMNQHEFWVHSSTVGRIRIAQNQMVPEKITRVVVELVGAVEFAVNLSSDRRTLSIDFEKNEIIDISFDTNNLADYVTITGTSQPNITIFPINSLSVILIDMPHTDVGGFTNQLVSGNFASRIFTERLDANTSRVTIVVREMPSHSITRSGNSVTIRLSTPTYENISFNDSRGEIVIPRSTGLSVSSIRTEDRYYNLQYVISLGGNFSDVLGFGENIINHGGVNSVVINTIANNTTITINTSRILAFNIREDAENIYITPVLPREKHSRIVILDPGHGGADPGTRGHGLIEKEVVLDISNRVLALLDASYHITGIKGYATRVDDSTVNLFDRAPFANELGDLFVSIHLNASETNPNANGTETYFYSNISDAASGITRRALAEIFHRNMLGALRLNDRGVREARFVVLRDTTIPSVFLEIAFLTNQGDAQRFHSSDFRQQAAVAIYESILETFSVYTPRR